jgi:hypothetical protein
MYIVVPGAVFGALFVAPAAFDHRPQVGDLDDRLARVLTGAVGVHDDLLV